MSKYTVTFPDWPEEATIEANTLKQLIDRLLDKCDGRLEVRGRGGHRFIRGQPVQNNERTRADNKNKEMKK